MVEISGKPLACPPRSASEAAAKLRSGLADFGRFALSAPCLALCWLAGRASWLKRRAEVFGVDHQGAIKALRFMRWAVVTAVPSAWFYVELLLHLMDL